MGEDGAPVEAPAPEGSDDQAQTVEIPLAALGGAMPKEGDTLQLKVVSVDEQGGVVNATAMKPEASGSATDEMADEFAPEKMAAKAEKPPMEKM